MNLLRTVFKTTMIGQPIRERASFENLFQNQSEYENSKKLELEIENRLADLRSDGPITKVRKPIVRVMSISREDEDEETAVKRIIDQTVNEGKLFILYYCFYLV